MSGSIIDDLYQNGLIQFGSFTLKSGEKSPIYFDLRKLGSYPELMNRVMNEVYFKTGQDNNLLDRFDLVCGVPVAGNALATAFSVIHRLPMIWVRKEAKEHGLKRLVEGDYQKGQRVLLIDDVITSGGSLCTTIQQLESVGLTVAEVRVLIDRRQSWAQIPYLADGDRTFPLKTGLTMDQILRSLNVITEIPIELKLKWFNFSERSKQTVNPMTRQLMRLMEKKKTNLVLSADVRTRAELISLIESCGSEIVVLKTHIDQIEDFAPDMIDQLCELKKKHNFLILEDRKFCDIGNTVKNQYTSGIFRIIQWADLVTVHTIMGPGTVQALSDAIGQFRTKSPENRGLLLLAQASSAGNLITNDYTQQTLEMANNAYPVVTGLICQKQLLSGGFLHFTPGVNLEAKGDILGQRYRTPRKVITESGCDLVIVGRGIYQNKEPFKVTREYRNQAWEAYQSL